MANLSHQILDDVLKIIEASTEDSPIDLEIMLKTRFLSLPNRDVKVIMDKLRKENLIDCVIPNKNTDDNGRQDFVKGREYYFITFEGLMLLQEGGYVGRLIREERENIRVAALEESQKENSNRLTYLTGILAFCSVAVFVVDVIKLCIEKAHFLGSIQLWTAFCLLLYCNIAVLILLLLIKQLKSLKKRKEP